MTFQVSPGVNVTEIDLTTIVPAVSTTVGALAGVFSWGPVQYKTLISTETELVNMFGKPTSSNFETFFTAANFLAYGNQLYVSRAAGASNYNAIANSTNGSSSTTVVNNIVDFQSKSSALSTNTSVNFVAKYPGSIGNSLQISVCPSANAFTQTFQTVNTATSDMLSSINVGSSTLALTFNNASGLAYPTANAIFNNLTVGDYISVGNSTIGTQYMQVSNIGAIVNTSSSSSTFNVTFTDTLKLKYNWALTNYSANSGTGVNFLTRYWQFFNLVDSAPATSSYVASRNTNSTVGDEMHVVVVDQDGVVTGVPNTVLEVWPHVSRASDAKGPQGGSIYYRDVLTNNSQWVWPAHDIFGTGTAATVTAVNDQYVFTSSFGGGGSDDTESSIDVGKILYAYDQFASADDVDVSLVMAGKAYGGINGEQVPNYIIDNICSSRKDCVAFISPVNSAVVNVPGFETQNVIAFRNLVHSSSYAVMDSGYKYQYDKYNDTYRWVPLNGDVAGLCVRTDNVRDPWFSPAGFNRGNIKNAVKLAFNPDKGHRDQLYKNGVNPVVNFQGQGVVLYGDKTLLAQPSAFDRINVRRLFIVLEKAIALAAQTSLFELNDTFTQSAFRNLVEPYLRDIQGRRGIYDFRVVCDSTNNTPEVVDANQFVGDIYVKPARSINFIQLNFVAVRTGVDFNEIVGSF